MSLPDGYLPRKDDVLILHATVKYDYDPAEGKEVWIDSDGPFTPLDKFVGIKRRTWKSGETVRHRNVEHCFGEVIATCDDMVWVKLGENSKHGKKFSQGPLATFHCNEIELLYPGRAADVPEAAPIIEPPNFPQAMEAADLGEDDDGASPQEDLGRDDPGPLRGVPL